MIKTAPRALGLQGWGGVVGTRGTEASPRLMDRFDGDRDFLLDASQKAGDYVQSLAGATQKILSDVEL